MNHVEIINDVFVQTTERTKIHFQKVVYCTDDYEEDGFRFIWSRDGRLLPHKGQARIPNERILYSLLEKAMADGWFK